MSEGTARWRNATKWSPEVHVHLKTATKILSLPTNFGAAPNANTSSGLSRPFPVPCRCSTIAVELAIRRGAGPRMYRPA